MRQNKEGKAPSYKSLLAWTSVMIATVAIIVYFMPRDTQFNYQFDLNKPWRYNQLIADFDFPIYKPDDIVKREQDSIRSHFFPYYSLDQNVCQTEILRLRSDYQSRLKNIVPSFSYIIYLQNTLEKIYNKGIISTENLNQIERDSLQGIMVVTDNTATDIPLEQLVSIKDAYNILLTSDSVHYRSDILRRCSLNDYLKANLTYDDVRTQKAEEEILDKYSWAYGMVQNGQKIAERGQIIDQETYDILESLRRESINRSESTVQKRLMLLGQVIFTGVFIAIFMIYLLLYRKDYLRRRNSVTLILSQMIVFCVITLLMVSGNTLNVYLLPYAMMALLLRIFLDARTAFMSYMTTILLCSICLHHPHEFILVQLAAGAVAIYSMRELTQRSQIYLSSILITLTYVTVYFAFELITENDISKLTPRMYIYLAVSGVLVLFAYPLMLLIEKMFGFTSNVTMIELSNTNNPLLRKMSETAPGTFQHSMQVANLASEVAIHIGANSQLVRTGALYHDIGKIENPAFFTENQTGSANPHSNLNYEQSAQVVINHVIDGMKLAEKHNLPRVIKQFITTHHGAGKTKYFYISWKNEHNGEEPPKEMFSYPGPDPSTKEQAILMMSDAVEAASRSLSEYTEKTIDNLVEKIVGSQVADGFFRNCPITFKDIETAKSVFKMKLKSMYHPRISYPELKK